MFTHDYTINGSHATKLKYLVKKKNEGNENQESQPYYFRRYIDVFMTAVVFGLLYNRRAVEDSSSDRARIYADAFVTENQKCEMLFQLVMLLDESRQLATEERLDRAFRDASGDDNAKKQANLALFNSYVLGGIDVLFDKLTSNCVNQEDYNQRALDVMRQFNEELNGIDISKKVARLLEDDD